jgi:hypothetical protein
MTASTPDEALREQIAKETARLVGFFSAAAPAC